MRIYSNCYCNVADLEIKIKNLKTWIYSNDHWVHASISFQVFPSFAFKFYFIKNIIFAFSRKNSFPFKQTLEFTVLAFKNVNDRVWKGESRNHLAADSHLLLQITDCACPFPLSPTLLAYRMFSRNRLISVSLHRIIWRETLPALQTTDGLYYLFTSLNHIRYTVIIWGCSVNGRGN